MPVDSANRQDWTVDTIIANDENGGDNLFNEYAKEFESEIAERYGDGNQDYVVTRSDFAQYIRDELLDNDSQAAKERDLMYVQEKGMVCGSCLEEHDLSYEEFARQYQDGDTDMWDGGRPFLQTWNPIYNNKPVKREEVNEALNMKRANADAEILGTAYCPDHNDDWVKYHEFFQSDDYQKMIDNGKTTAEALKDAFEEQLQDDES